MQQPGGQTSNGEAPISNGGLTPLPPPLATTLFTAVKNNLFGTYYMPLYACHPCHQWCKCTQSGIWAPPAAHNNPFCISIYIPRNGSVRLFSQIKLHVSPEYFDAFIRNNLHVLLQWCASSSKFFIRLHQLSDVFHKYPFFPLCNASAWKWADVVVTAALLQCLFIFRIVCMYHLTTTLQYLCVLWLPLWYGTCVWAKRINKTEKNN